jgi:COX assembly protein 1
MMMTTQANGTKPALPSRNPLPLSASQEGQVRELYYKRVRGYCANEIRGETSVIPNRDLEANRSLDFASCALNRTISATWACRNQRLAMNSCMISHATQEEQDAAREEWFATRDKRAEERAAKERKRIEQEKFHREWWGLPPKEREEKEKTEK